MNANEIIRLIDNNIHTIKSSEDKIAVIIDLLEKHNPKFNLYTAVHGSTEEFYHTTFRSI